MGLVHTLVAEVLAHLIDALETAYYQALQVQLRSDTHIHILIKGIEVGHKRTSTRSSWYILQYRGINLCIASIIEDATQSTYYGGTLQECLFHTFVHHEVNITLTVAQLWVVKLIISHTILILHYRQWLERLTQKGQFLSVD